MAYVLTFNKRVTLDGYVYPAGAIVPAGVLTTAKLRSLRDSNWIVETREEELQAVEPYPVPDLDPRVVAAARDHAETKRREYEAALRSLTSLEASVEADRASVTRPTDEPQQTVDLSEVAVESEKPKGRGGRKAAEPEQTAPASAETAEATPDADDEPPAEPALPPHLS